MGKFIAFIGRINETIGNVAAPITLFITAIVLLEVIARYVFNAPTSWANEVSEYLLCALVMFGGGFALRYNGHTRMDIVHARLSERTSAWIEILTGFVVLTFTGPMMWFGSILALEAFQSGQTSVSAARLPLWPSMAAVPLGAFFMALQGIANALDGVKNLTLETPAKG
jgi:TRAP-type mannitol/chloroaromatic compound transport system permease small subunit